MTRVHDGNEHRERFAGRVGSPATAATAAAGQRRPQAARWPMRPLSYALACSLTIKMRNRQHTGTCRSNLHMIQMRHALSLSRRVGQGESIGTHAHVLFVHSTLSLSRSHARAPILIDFSFDANEHKHTNRQQLAQKCEADKAKQEVRMCECASHERLRAVVCFISTKACTRVLALHTHIHTCTHTHTHAHTRPSAPRARQTPWRSKRAGRGRCCKRN